LAAPPPPPAPSEPALSPPGPTEGRLAGIRAWLNELDEKVSTRTAVFLVLAALAIGAAAAAIYLALDAQDDAGGVSRARVGALEARLDRVETDVRELTDSIDAVSNEAVDAGAAARRLESRLDALSAGAADLGTGAGGGSDARPGDKSSGGSAAGGGSAAAGASSGTDGSVKPSSGTASR